MINMYTLRYEQYIAFFLHNYNAAKRSISLPSSSVCKIFSPQIPLFVSRIQKCGRAAGLLHSATLSQRQRATPRFQSILNPKPTL